MNSKITIFSTKKLSSKKVTELVLIDSHDFIKIKPIKPKETISFLNIIFTSKNAVKNAFENYDLLNKGYLFFCVGEKTAQSITNKGVSVSLIEINAEELANKLILTNNKNSYTFFCGENHLETLPSLLELNKIPLQKIVVYKTITNSVKLNKEYAGYVFFSPSGLTSFLTKNTIPVNAQIFSIGNTTAKAIKKRVNNQVIIATESKIESVINTIKEFYTYVKK